MTDVALSFGGWLGWLLMSVYSWTCRVSVAAGVGDFERARDGDLPVLVAFWHDQLPVLAPVLFHRLHRGGRPLTLLVSQSRDGELGTRILRHWQLYPVRGSSSRGGNQALRRLYHQMRAEGVSPVIIPDGPRGPKHVAKPGLAMFASLSGSSVLLLAASARPAHRIGSWDRMMVPWPFAAVRVSARLLPPEDLAGRSVDEASKKIESELSTLQMHTGKPEAQEEA